MALTHTFAATGQSGSFRLRGKGNILIYGGAATVKVERTFDSGTTWKVVSRDLVGNEASYTTSSAAAAVNTWLEEPEDGVLYRFNCTAYTSGSVVCRMSS